MKSLKVMLVSMLAMVGFNAQAAITALDVAPIETDITATITNVTPVVLSIMALVIGLVIGVKLVKKLVSSAA